MYTVHKWLLPESHRQLSPFNAVKISKDGKW
jgi:hypothetical protein